MLLMSGLVAILEDDAGRIAAMRASLAKVLPGTEALFFENARKTIAWLGEHQGEVVLISLDHDLPLRNDAGLMMDFGTGREVADYLASVLPTCPVIVHSSNDHGASGMFFALRDAGWPCGRVYPCDDQVWISDAWAEQVRRYVRDGWVNPAG
jgi:hypothetical protein